MYFDDLIPAKAPSAPLTFNGLISQRGLASMLPAQTAPTQPGGGMTFDEFLPKGTAPTQSGRYFDDVPNKPSGMTFDEFLPQNAAQQGKTFDFTGPDGKQYTVNGPDGATAQQAFGILQQHMGQNPQDGTDAGDIAKSGGVGLLKGVIGLAGLPGDAGNIGAQGIDAATRFIQRKLGLPESEPYDPNSPTLTGHRLPGATKIQSKVEDLTGPLYEPQTTAGKYAQSIGEFAPAIFGGPEGIGARLLGRVVAPAVASEGLGEATEGTAAEPFARIGGAMLGAGAGGALGRGARSAAAPTAEELQSAINGAGRGYNAPAVQDLRLAPEAMGRLADKINDDLLRNKIDPLNAPNVSRTVNQLGNGARFEEPTAQTNTVLSGPGYHIADDITQPAPYQIADIDLARQSLGDAPFEERRAAGIARSAIDNYLGSIPQSDVVAGDAAAANRALIDARGNVASLKRSQDVSNALGRAENQAGSTYSGHNLDNATRQQLRPILNQKEGVSKTPGFEDYTDDELAALKKEVNGNWLRNSVRDVGKQLGSGGGLGNIAAGVTVGGSAHGEGADLPTSIALGLATMAGGRALGGLANRMTAAEAERMAALLRSRSPLADQMRANAPASLLGNVRRNLLRGAVLSLPAATGQ